MSEEMVRDKLKALRERAGLSYREMGEALGQAHSTYASYEKLFKKSFFPVDYVQKLVPILLGRGTPPIEISEISELAGAEIQAPELRGGLNSVIEEIAVTTSAGAGADDIELDGNGRHAVLARWQFPSDYLHSVASNPNDIKIIRVVGDSMEPDYNSGDRIMVDTSHLVPSPPAVYVLYDGFGLIIKQLELISNSPPRVRITSRNKHYNSYEANLDDLRICGRVMGKWAWK